ncbi:MAG: flagellar basal body rod modification protein [Rhodobacteraceae bacterium CG2_30_10_405]|nr:flagellar basal body rod modification protein [Rhodobacterales bacterium]NCO16669.1 flagellar basal body rod modification protein [Alphaproteobacteria bacterium]OIQ06479.1 MAG: flagellar basal body rod modification protein [Rhodobacteraceae bacterium CG2_30_10_405]
MDVTQATLATLPTPTTSVATGSSSINADFDTFLQMLTTQLQNQDPMNPLNSSDFAVQLATFSGVEQQAMTNNLLGGMQSQLALMDMAQMAGWVGLEARVAAPAWVTPGQPVPLSPNPAAAADRAVLVVRDAHGLVATQQDIPVAADELSWMPVDSAGAPLAEGSYSFQLENYAGDQLLATTDVEVYAPIREVQNRAGGTTLILQGGIAVPALAVTAIRGG